MLHATCNAKAAEAAEKKLTSVHLTTSSSSPQSQHSLHLAPIPSMASIVPASVLLTLVDVEYDNRKSAATEIWRIVEQLILDREHDKINEVISLLTTEFVSSTDVIRRKGGLTGIAGVAVGLKSEATRYIEQLVPPVIKSFEDQDCRVRYYACEALYNIAKFTRGDSIIYFDQIFDALGKLSADSDAELRNGTHHLNRLVQEVIVESDQFRVEEFISLLKERMDVVNPYVQKFLLGWIDVLSTVPQIEILDVLPDFLDGLFNMLSDSNHEIRQHVGSTLTEFLRQIKSSPDVDYGPLVHIVVQRAASKDEFTRLTSITWINEFVKLDVHKHIPSCTDILDVLQLSLSDKEEKIRKIAYESYEKLRSLHADPAK